jgi:tetratricopeptide (TPR) repeat protein
MRRRLIAATSIAIVIGSLAPAFAARQVPLASPPGWGKVWATVKDPNGAVILGARVSFRSGGLRRQAVTVGDYIYEADLPPGTYSLAARAQGFCPTRIAEVRVEPGAVRNVEVNLKVAAIANVINVEDGSEEDILVDPETNKPCALEPRPAPRALSSPQTLLASAQTRATKRPAAKPPAAAKPSTKTAAKPSTKTAAKPSAKTAAKPSSGAPAAKSTATAKAPAGVVQISTQPGAVVWVDEVRRGAADAEGKLQLKLTPGRHALRVRAAGYAERTLPILPAQRGALSVVLTKTTDEAELLFQQAEEAREKGNAAGAVELYRQALKLRPRYAAAHLGLARALESQENFDEALEEIQAARAARPSYAEASAVEGRIQRSLADPEAALAAYRRALRESNGFQPEAYTGMGIVYEDRGQNEEAAAAFRKAVAQLSDTEPILYELLARNLEKLERWKEAVAAYEKYLELAPTGAHASAINSIIDQLRRQAAESEQQQPPE